MSRFPQVRPGRVYGHLDQGSLMQERLVTELRAVVVSRPDAIAMIEFHSRSGARRQIDIAVLSPGGVDVIELKQHSGHVTGGPGETWYCGKRPMGNQRMEGGRSIIENPMQQASNSADDLKQWLISALCELTGSPYEQATRSLEGRVRPLVWLPNVRSASIGKGSHCWHHIGSAGLAEKLRCLSNGAADDPGPWTPGAYLRVPSMLGMEALDLMRVQGAVTDAFTRTPVARVMVTLGNQPSERALETGQQGEFEFSAAPGQHLTLRLKPGAAHRPREAELSLPAGRAWRIPEEDLALTPSLAPDAEQTAALLHLQARVEALTQEVNRLNEEGEDARAHREAERIRAEEALQAAEQLVEEAGSDLARARQAALDLEVLKGRLAQERTLREQAEEEARKNLTLTQHALVSATQAQLNIERAASEGQAAFDEALTEAKVSMERQKEEHDRELSALRQRLSEAAAYQAQQEEALKLENEQLRGAQERLHHEGEAARSWAQNLEAQLRLRAMELNAQGELIAQLQRAQAERSQGNSAGPAGAASPVPEVPRRVRHIARVRLLTREGSSAAGNALTPPGAPTPAAPPADPGWRAEWETQVQHLTLEGLLLSLSEAEQRLSLTPDSPARTQLLEVLSEARIALDDPDLVPPDEAAGMARSALLRLPASVAQRLGSSVPETAAPLPAAQPRVSVLKYLPERWRGSGASNLPEAGHVLQGGMLRHLENRQAPALEPELSELETRELDGLCGLLTGEGLIPGWLLPEEAWAGADIPGSWVSEVRRALEAWQAPEHGYLPDIQPLQEVLSGLNLVRVSRVLGTLERSAVEELGALDWEEPAHAEAVHLAMEQLFIHQVEGLTPGTVHELPPNPKYIEPSLELPLLQALPDASTPSGPGLALRLEALGLRHDLARVIGRRMKAPYLHQGLALDQIRRSRPLHGQRTTHAHDVILATPTASGKTMSFLPGILEGLLSGDGTALMLYPLRALCADQVGTLKEVLGALAQEGSHLSMTQHYGSHRGSDVREPRVVVATPDKLNYALGQEWWGWVSQRLEYIVLDEAHTYRGSFGNHVAGLLRRILSQAPRRPTIVISSATLKNTGQFARRLTGRPTWKVIGRSSAPRYPRHVYVSVGIHGGPRQHRAGIDELHDTLVQRRAKGLLFVPGRKTAQNLSHDLSIRQQRLTGLGGTAQAFYSGMGGYAAALAEFKASVNDPRLGCSTSTLEAGVDIGDLSFAGILGFPRTRNTFKQMAGRAGRGRTGHVVFLPGLAPVDQFYAQEHAIKQLLASESEAVYLESQDPETVARHLRQAAREQNLDLTSEPRSLEEAEQRREEIEALTSRLFPDEHVPEAFRGTVLEKVAEQAEHERRKPGGDLTRPPALRGPVGVPHVVVRFRTADEPEGDPLITATHLRLEWDQGDWLIEHTDQERALWDWPRGGRAWRGNHMYVVCAWRRVKLSSEESPMRDAVAIFVRDVTEQTLTPDEVSELLRDAAAARALGTLSSGEALDTGGRHVPQRPKTPTHLEVKVMDGERRSSLGALTAVHGRGSVQRSRSEDKAKTETLITVQECRRAREKPRSRALRDVKGRRSFQVSVVNASGEVLKQGRTSDTAEPASLWKTLREAASLSTVFSSTPHGWAVGSHRFYTSPLRAFVDEQRLPTLEVLAHQHSLQGPTTCSCGSPTEERDEWKELDDTFLEPDPAGCTGLPAHVQWEALPTEQPVLSTAVTRLHLRGADSESRQALLLALLKVVPDTLQVDAAEISAGLGEESPEPDGGRAGEQESVLTLWDRKPGEAPVCAQMLENLPALLRGASALLQASLTCECRGAGCVGCILPLEALQNIHAEEPPRGDTVTLDLPGAAALALRLIAQAGGAANWTVPEDRSSTGSRSSGAPESLAMVGA